MHGNFFWGGEGWYKSRYTLEYAAIDWLS